jgi:phosphoglycolate phosphatase-like HAD superfamily hydrolase/membrane protease YdiL (CAAX protease family)
MYHYVLFDLDGTLTDLKEEIYENQLYPGMEEFLSSLTQQGIRLAIASDKPRDFVQRILEYFKIDGYFEVVTGSEKDERKAEKTEVIRETLSELFGIKEESLHFESLKEAKRILPLDDILMVGDRKFDVLGAKHFFLHSAGVSYGYAQEGELEEAGADYITDNLEELYQIITGESRWKQNSEKAWKKSIKILSPVVYAYLITNLIVAFLTIGLDGLRNGWLQSCNVWIDTHSSQLAVYFDTAATIICTVVLWHIYRKERIQPISDVIKRRLNQKLIKESIPLIGLSVCMALFLNMLIIWIGTMNISASYETTAAIQYSVPILFGMINYGLIKPLEEELLFRGLVYGRMRRYFPKIVAIPVSALLFAAYHGNLVQLLYAWLMGSLLAWAYERYKKLGASILVHGMANLAVYLTCTLPQVYQLVFSKWGCLLTGLIMVVILIGFCRKSVCKKIVRKEKTL